MRAPLSSEAGADSPHSKAVKRRKNHSSPGSEADEPAQAEDSATAMEQPLATAEELPVLKKRCKAETSLGRSRSTAQCSRNAETTVETAEDMQQQQQQLQQHQQPKHMKAAAETSAGRSQSAAPSCARPRQGRSCSAKQQRSKSAPNWTQRWAKGRRRLQRLTNVPPPSRSSSVSSSSSLSLPEASEKETEMMLGAEQQQQQHLQQQQQQQPPARFAAQLPTPERLAQLRRRKLRHEKVDRRAIRESMRALQSKKREMTAAHSEPSFSDTEATQAVAPAQWKGNCPAMPSLQQQQQQQQQQEQKQQTGARTMNRLSTVTQRAALAEAANTAQLLLVQAAGAEQRAEMELSSARKLRRYAEEEVPPGDW